MFSQVLLTLSLACLLLFSAQPAMAQDSAQDSAQDPVNPPDAVLAAAEPQHEPVPATPALFSVGISGGFPSYQTVALSVSLQSSFVGLQAKGSWTAVGPYLGLQLRGYPPVPIPLPIYLGLGVGIYGSNVSYHAALGAHVPLARALRFDVEAGVASVPLLDQRSLAPHVAVGLSYALPVRLDASSDMPGIGRSVSDRSASSVTAPTCADPAEPDASRLGDAVERVVDDWIASARATYGSVYTDLDYSYSVTSSNVSGNRATVRVSYAGSVREIATGRRHEASGSATAEFEWNGCTWFSRGVSY